MSNKTSRIIRAHAKDYVLAIQFDSGAVSVRWELEFLVYEEEQQKANACSKLSAAPDRSLDRMHRRDNHCHLFCLSPGTTGGKNHGRHPRSGHNRGIAYAVAAPARRLLPAKEFVCNCQHARSNSLTADRAEPPRASEQVKVALPKLRYSKMAECASDPGGARTSVRSKLRIIVGSGRFWRRCSLCGIVGG